MNSSGVIFVCSIKFGVFKFNGCKSQSLTRSEKPEIANYVTRT